MKLIETSKCVFITMECYSTNEDIQNTFLYTLQAGECERVTDREIAQLIERLRFGYDYDVREIYITRQTVNGQFETTRFDYDL